MTLAIAVVCPDGIAMAADSRTTRYGQNYARVLSDATHKLFEVNDCLIATFGWAFLQGRNIASHLAEFRSNPHASPDAGPIANELADFMKARVDAHIAQNPGSAPPTGADTLAFLVGGCDGKVSRTYEVLLPSRTVVNRHDSVVNTGAVWRGQTDVLSRVVLGADLELLADLAAADGKASELQSLAPTISGLKYVIPFDAMNLQDAIDFALFAMRTTIDVQRLTYGTQRNPQSWPGVGGPVELAVVTPTEGVNWIQQKVLLGERPAGEAERV